MNPFICFSCLGGYIYYGLRVPFKLITPKGQVDHIYNFFSNLTVYPEVNILHWLWHTHTHKDKRYNFTTVEFLYLFQIFFTKRFPKFEIYILDQWFNSWLTFTSSETPSLPYKIKWEITPQSLLASVASADNSSQCLGSSEMLRRETRDFHIWKTFKGFARASYVTLWQPNINDYTFWRGILN